LKGFTEFFKGTEKLVSAWEGFFGGCNRVESRRNSGFKKRISLGKYQKDGISDAVAQADAWLASVADARSIIGTRENGMDTQKANNDDLQLYLKENVSNLEDLDYAEATGRFMLQQTALTASQQTFSQISQLSLFNYIR
jgi:flagellar hook-associated protein 3 FlgL